MRKTSNFCRLSELSRQFLDAVIWGYVLSVLKAHQLHSESRRGECQQLLASPEMFPHNMNLLSETGNQDTGPKHNSEVLLLDLNQPTFSDKLLFDRES
jgi:hypothetical protein